MMAGPDLAYVTRPSRRSGTSSTYHRVPCLAEAIALPGRTPAAHLRAFSPTSSTIHASENTLCSCSDESTQFVALPVQEDRNRSRDVPAVGTSRRTAARHSTQAGHTLCSSAHRLRIPLHRYSLENTEAVLSLPVQGLDDQTCALSSPCTMASQLLRASSETESGYRYTGNQSPPLLLWCRP